MSVCAIALVIDRLDNFELRFSLGFRHSLFFREQQRKLNEKLKGHDAYYGVTHNLRMLQMLRWELLKHWRKWLNRRNRKGGIELETV